MNLTPCCQFCSVSQNHLLRCSGCKVVRYCSQDHQVADRPQHKSVCNAIKRSSARLDLEEHKLRNQPDDGNIFAPPNVFEDHVGHFWGLHNTRPYMRARYGLVEAVLMIRTRDAVVMALKHVMDCLRLCRSDNMGVRYCVPGLLLRLGRDQECYDFVKWWATTGSKSDYDYSDLDEPFLDLKGSDVLESPQYLCRHIIDLSHVVSIALLKIRLLLAVRAGTEGWQEILRSSPIFNQLEDSFRQNAPIEDHETESVKVTKILKVHINELYQAVDRLNPYFWGALLNPGKNLNAYPSYFSNSSEEEMQMVLRKYYDAWKESPGTIEVIDAILGKKEY